MIKSVQHGAWTFEEDKLLAQYQVRPHPTKGQVSVFFEEPCLCPP